MRDEVSAAAVLAILEDDIPEAYQCPLTLEIMRDPVCVPGGQTFERTWIIAEIARHGWNPLTKIRLRERELIPNLALKTLIENYCREKKVVLPPPPPVPSQYLLLMPEPRVTSREAATLPVEPVVRLHREARAYLRRGDGMRLRSGAAREESAFSPSAVLTSETALSSVRRENRVPSRRHRIRSPDRADRRPEEGAVTINIPAPVSARAQNTARESGDCCGKVCCGFLILVGGIFLLGKPRNNDENSIVKLNITHSRSNFSELHRGAVSLSANTDSAAGIGVLVTISVVGVAFLLVMGLLFSPAIKRQVTRCREAFFPAAPAAENAVDVDAVTLDVTTA